MIKKGIKFIVFIIIVMIGIYAVKIVSEKYNLPILSKVSEKV